jgi:ribosomal protein S18 acetylase RimI-like enzyme
VPTRTEPTLLPFSTDAAGQVAAWATTPAEVTAWCSRTEAPVPAEIVAGWSQQPDVRAYLLLADDAPVGYGELWIDDDEAEVELAHLIVAPGLRGRHLGRALARLLAAEAHRAHPTVFLRLHPGNDAALACYRAAGFTRLDPDTERDWNQAQPTSYLWLAHRP